MDITHWQTPPPEAQELLRDRFKDVLRREPQSRVSISREIRMAPQTIGKFMSGEDVEWLSYCKLEAFIKRKTERLAQ